MGKFLPKLLNSILPTWFAKLKKMLLQQQQPSSAGNLLPYNRPESPIQEQEQAQDDPHTHSESINNFYIEESNHVDDSSPPNPTSLPPPLPSDGSHDQISATSCHSLPEESPCSPGGGGGGGDGERKSLPSYEREDYYFPPGQSMEAGFASRSSMDIANEVEGSSVPQVQNSYCPYEDLRDSMKEMIAFHQYTRDAQVLGYILYCYFSLNEPSLHDSIERAFVDACQELFHAHM